MEVSYKSLREKLFKVLKEYETYKFRRHLIIYVVINAFLLYINLVYSPEYIWFIYPLLFWGMGVAIHYISIERKAKVYLSMLDDCMNELISEEIAVKKN